MNKHLVLDNNQRGNDYLVGDIHGEYQLLYNLLNEVNFDIANDRLISVGDIIDRGPDSPKCLDLIDNDWFFMVKGNHEQMMIDTINNPDDPDQLWAINGGLWGYYLPIEQLMTYKSKLEQLPLIITIGQDNNKFHVAHAEISSNNGLYQCSDHIIDNWLFNKEDEDNLLWGRNISSMQHFNQPNLSPVFVGHTIKNPMIIKSNHHFIDQGSCLHKSTNAKHAGCTLSLTNPLTKQHFKILNNSLLTENFNAT